MPKLRLIIEHEPLAWKRPGQSGKIRFDLQKSIKETLSYFFIKAMREQNIKTFTGPVSVKIVAWYNRPKRLASKRLASKSLDSKSLDSKSNKHYFHQVKPDCDNVAKLYLDIMTMAHVWLDDAQCFNLSVSKNYIYKDTRVKECPHVKPCVFFEIEELPTSGLDPSEVSNEDTSIERTHEDISRARKRTKQPTNPTIRKVAAP